MKPLASLVAILALIALPMNARAIFGVGDISFDPTVYAEIIKLYEQGKELYKSAMDQLDRLDKMQRTIAEAHQAYDRLVNVDVHKMAEDLKPGKYMKYANGENRFRLMRAELSNLRDGIEGDVDFIQGQLSRIDALETLVGVQNAAAGNMQAAAKDLDDRRSNQITAQSTATLSALAAAEAQRHQQQDMALVQERAQQQAIVLDALKIYQALGSSASSTGAAASDSAASIASPNK